MALGRSRIRHSGDTLVLALVSSELRQRLAARISSITMCESWDELSGALENIAPTVVFLDPAIGDDFQSRTIAIRERHPMAALVVYTEVKPSLIKRALPVFSAGASDLVLAGFDDTTERLASLIAEIQTRNLAEPLLGMISTEICALPEEVRSAVDAMFADPTRVRTVDNLARLAGTSRRRLFRTVKAAGFQSARLLVASARVSAACRLLVQSGRTVSDTAAMLRYSSADLLCRHFLFVVGRPPREVKASLSVTDAYHIIASRLIRAQLAHSSVGHSLQNFAEARGGNRWAE